MIHIENPVLVKTTLFSALRNYMDTRWPPENRKNNKTCKEAQTRLNAFMAVTRDRDCDNLLLEECIEAVQLFIDFRVFKKLSGCSIDNDRRALSAAFAWLIKKRMVPFRHNPAQKSLLNCPVVVTRCKPALNHDDVQALLTATRETELFPYVLLCLGAGLRLVGAWRVGLAQEQLDLVAKTLLVFEKNRERIIPLSMWFQSEFAAWSQKYEWQHLHYDTVTHRLAKLRDEKGLPKTITMQALRRTFLKRLFDANVPPQVAAKLAGNSVAVIEKHYVDFQTMSAHGHVDVLDFSKKG